MLGVRINSSLTCDMEEGPHSISNISWHVNFVSLVLIVTSSTIDKKLEIFGPNFEQNITINFEPIFEQNANFDPIF